MTTSYKLKPPTPKKDPDSVITTAYSIVQSNRDKALHQLVKLTVKGDQVIEKEYGEEDNLMFIGPRILREFSRMDINFKDD